MGSVIAEHLRARDIPVTLVTPETMVSAWGNHTSEQALVHRRMLEAGVELVTAYGLSAFNGQTATIECIYSGNRKNIDVEAVVTVTMRSPDEPLFRELQQRIESGAEPSPVSGTVRRHRLLPVPCLPVTSTPANSTPR
jgi:dimethylamine/trimethylamine dehydrogenase